MFTLLVKVGMKTKEGKKILKELKKEGSTWPDELNMNYTEKSYRLHRVARI
jgi:hypothetical protein